MPDTAAKRLRFPSAPPAIEEFVDSYLPHIVQVAEMAKTDQAVASMMADILREQLITGIYTLTCSEVRRQLTAIEDLNRPR